MAFLSCLFYERADFLWINVIPCGSLGGSGIKWQFAKYLFFFEVAHEGGIDGCAEFFVVGEAFAHELALYLLDEGLLLGVAVGGALDEGDAVAVVFGGLPVFALCGRDAVRVFVAVLLAEDAEVDVASCGLAG